MARSTRVLIVEDDADVRNSMAEYLASHGYEVDAAEGGDAMRAALARNVPQLVLLDLKLPGEDGLSLARSLRERHDLAIIMVTAADSVIDRVVGLEVGADDYIAKPFHPDELAARTRAVLRRSSGGAPGAGIVRFDDIEIDLERRMVTRGGELVQLSRTEWLLLQHLAANAGKVVLHTELLTKVWGPEYRDDLQYLRVWVSRVRRKLGAKPGEPGRIKTFQGIGYLLDIEGAPVTTRHEADEIATEATAHVPEAPAEAAAQAPA